MAREITLTPVQQTAAEELLTALGAGHILVLRAAAGMGRTTVLQAVHSSAGGAFAGVTQFMDVLASRQPAAIEEAFLQMIEQALARHDLVIVDDLHLVASVVHTCNYARSYLFDASLTAIMGEAGARRKELLFGIDEGDAPWPVQRRAYAFEIGEFTPADYECICRAYLEPDAWERLDYAKIHCFAPALNAHQLKNACVWLAHVAELHSDRFIEYLAFPRKLRRKHACQSA
jgi:hypothetical protein